jgi:hypothetical protein
MAGRALTAAFCVAAVLGAGGCGGDDGGSAEDAAQSYADARSQGDAAAECDLYSDHLKQQLGASNCEAFVKEQMSGLPAQEVKVVTVKQHGDSAAAAELETTGESGKPVQLEILLVREDGDWLISSVGGGTTGG